MSARGFWSKQTWLHHGCQWQRRWQLAVGTHAVAPCVGVASRERVLRLRAAHREAVPAHRDRNARVNALLSPSAGHERYERSGFHATRRLQRRRSAWDRLNQVLHVRGRVRCAISATWERLGDAGLDRRGAIDPLLLSSAGHVSGGLIYCSLQLFTETTSPGSGALGKTFTSSDQRRIRDNAFGPAMTPEANQSGGCFRRRGLFTLLGLVAVAKPAASSKCRASIG